MVCISVIIRPAGYDGNRRADVGIANQGVCMAPEPPKTARPFSRRLTNIVTIINRYHIEAERKGDIAFAEALKSCATAISGGNLTCPLGQLVLDETVRTGIFPLSALTPQAPGRSESAPAMGSKASLDSDMHPALKAVEWRNTFFKLWALLEEEARRTGDKTCLEALQECAEPSTSHKCPVRELIARHLPHGTQSTGGSPASGGTPGPRI